MACCDERVWSNWMFYDAIMIANTIHEMSGTRQVDAETCFHGIDGLEYCWECVTFNWDCYSWSERHVKFQSMCKRHAELDAILMAVAKST